MNNISAFTEAIKKIPQLLSSASQEAWETITAVASGVIITTGSAVAGYKLLARRPKDESPVASKEEKALCVWDELKISPKYRQEVTLCIEKLQFSLSKLKREKEFQIKDPQDALPLVPLLDNLLNALQKAEGRTYFSDSPHSKAPIAAKLKKKAERLSRSITQVQQHRLGGTRGEQFVAQFPKKLENLEKLLNKFEKEFK